MVASEVFALMGVSVFVVASGGGSVASLAFFSSGTGVVGADGDVG